MASSSVSETIIKAEEKDKREGVSEWTSKEKKRSDDGSTDSQMVLATRYDRLRLITYQLHSEYMKPFYSCISLVTNLGTLSVSFTESDPMVPSKGRRVGMDKQSEQVEWILGYDKLDATIPALLIQWFRETLHVWIASEDVSLTSNGRVRILLTVTYLTTIIHKCKQLYYQLKDPRNSSHHQPIWDSFIKQEEERIGHHEKENPRTSHLYRVIEEERRLNRTSRIALATLTVGSLALATAALVLSRRTTSTCYYCLPK